MRFSTRPSLAEPPGVAAPHGRHPSPERSSSPGDGTPDDTSDVVGLLTERIENRFGMSVGQLRAAVTASPTAHPDATSVIRGHGLLVEAQAVLDRAEDDLLAALASQSGELDAATMGLAHRVNTAVTVRDGRAMTLRWRLDPDAPGKSGLAAQRLARVSRSGASPSVRAGAPPRPAAAPAPRAGRALR